MKKNLTLALALIAVASVALQGCGPQTRDSMKRDVNYAADKIDGKVDDARD